VSGGLLGSVAAGLAIPLVVHLGVSALVFGVLALLAFRALLPGDDDADRDADATTDGEETPAAQQAPGRPSAVLALAALGVLAACGAFVEDAGASWSALYLRTELAAGAAAAGLGFVALQGAMTIGRLTGDRVVDRFGQRRVVRVGGALTAAGMGWALAFPSVPTTLVGFALAGLGVATLVPAVYHAADELPGLRRGTGLAVINWLLRIGFLLSPPLIGVLADATSLRVALLAVVVAGLGALLLGRVLPAAAAPR
jgi:MFS family permease